MNVYQHGRDACEARTGPLDTDVNKALSKLAVTHAPWRCAFFAYFLVCILGVMVLGPRIKDPMSSGSFPAPFFVAAAQALDGSRRATAGTMLRTCSTGDERVRSSRCPATKK